MPVRDEAPDVVDRLWYCAVGSGLWKNMEQSWNDDY